MHLRNRLGSGLQRIESEALTPLLRLTSHLKLKIWSDLSDPRRKPYGRLLGTVSLRSSNRFPYNSGPPVVSPVILPPGRARLLTRPALMGSLTDVKTIGIVLVAFLAARAGPAPSVATRTSTLRPISSVARSASRSSFPSARRYSIRIFFPSAYPSSRSPCRKASRVNPEGPPAR